MSSKCKMFDLLPLCASMPRVSRRDVPAKCVTHEVTDTAWYASYYRRH